MTATAVTTRARCILEDAIKLYLETIGEPHLFITGWVVSVALASPDDENDRYVNTRTPGMPYHTALGLFYKGIESLRRS